MIAASVLLTVLFGATTALQRIDQTPKAVAVETIISSGQEIDDLEDLAEALNLDCDDWDLKVEYSRYIESDLTRQRLRLYYKGLKVRAFTLQATINDEGKYTGKVSGYLPTIDSNFDSSSGSTTKKKDVKNALVQYVNDQNIRINQGDIDKNDLDNFEYERQISIDYDTGDASVVFYAEARVNIINYIRNPHGLFDSSLELIRGRVGVRNAQSDTDQCPNAIGGNDGYPGLTYGPQNGQTCLEAYVSGANCKLKNDLIKVKDAQNTIDRNSADTVKFKCADGLDDRSNGANSPNADTFFYANTFFEVVAQWGKQSTFSFTPITLYTHYGSWTNSFWDGKTATFGDSDANVYPYAVKEVIGHELGHAITEDNNNLNFDGESAAVDESFSDICGKAITVYLSTDGSFEWGFAQDVVRSGDRSGIRAFDDPSADGRTIDNVANFHTVEANHPALGVGVFDKAFYLTVTGGISFQQAFEVFVLANQVYWHEDTGFFDGACGVLRAASDLGQDTSIYASSFSAVGIDLSWCSLAGTA